MLRLIIYLFSAFEGVICDDNIGVAGAVGEASLEVEGGDVNREALAKNDVAVAAAVGSPEPRVEGLDMNFRTSTTPKGLLLALPLPLTKPMAKLSSSNRRLIATIRKAVGAIRVNAIVA